MTPPPPTRPGGPHHNLPLAERLARELAERWRRGDCAPAEAFLDRHPELWDDPEEAAEVVFEEVAARRERGEDGAPASVFARFPTWRRQLERLHSVWQLVEEQGRPEGRVGPGDRVAGCELLAELGRGGRGRVFLAAQRGLADRPVVVKLTPLDAGREHLSLARLQHTNVVPLLAVDEDVARGLRVLSMPYFGGATLDRVLEGWRDRPPGCRSGRDLLAAVDRETASRPVPVSGSTGGPVRTALADADYVRAVCWAGARLAEALDYAHGRGLVHLDVKPANVLIAVDGQPMLLDFHLAHPPVAAGEAGFPWLGGTPGYMAPEQAAALAAVRAGTPVPTPVDGRADVYALAAVLYELLGGGPPEPGVRAARLERLNPAVGLALADAIHRCLRPVPAERYPSAGLLAADLRRHLADEPLRGVPNRSLRERWAKWRRRSPHRLAQAGTAAAVLVTLAAGTAAAVAYLSDQSAAARRLLSRAAAGRDVGHLADALRTLDEARAAARRLPLHGGLRDQAEEDWRRTHALLVREGRAAGWAAGVRQVAGFADRVRFLSGAGTLPPSSARGVGGECEDWWRRGLELDAAAGDAPAGGRDRLRRDLLDLALVWAELTIAADGPAGADRARDILAGAAGRFGTTPALADELRRLGGDPGMPPPPVTAWDHYALGRAALRCGDLERADALLARAVSLDPQGLWPNFHYGVGAFRCGRYDDAAAAFSACVALTPAAECFYNRGLAFDRFGRADRALADYDAALRLDPALAPAALNRGVLHLAAGRLAAAEADFAHALRHGADPAVVRANQDLVRRAREAVGLP
ncbi:tetratricopeptide repeat protein [bacterium]|nr:tetratricopeptide repeat protein [bacterium]